MHMKVGSRQYTHVYMLYLSIRPYIYIYMCTYMHM